MPDAYYTVVYKVAGDAAAQDAWWQALRPLFLSEQDLPIKITAIAKADELARLDNIHEILNGRLSDADMIDAVRLEMERCDASV